MHRWPSLSLGLLLILTPFMSSAVPLLSSRFEQELPNESADIENVRKGILSIQADTAKNNDGKALRGTHSKGVCVKGEFELWDPSTFRLPPELIQRLKVGVFKNIGKYPATIRFANAASEIESDWSRDVRALSFAAEMPEGRMDFSMNDASTFPINDAHEFANLMIFAMSPVGGAWQLGTEMGGVLAALARGSAQKSLPFYSYQTLDYWSDVPFLLGKNEAVKYSLKHCDANLHQETFTRDTLSDEILRHVKNDAEMSCFYFQVQFLDANLMTDSSGVKHSEQYWVENASEDWNPSQAPFHPIGMLTLVRNSALEPAECEKLRINVNVNTTADHGGLGSINRARVWAEKDSSEHR